MWLLKRHLNENRPLFYSFVLPSEEEDTSLNGNSFATAESSNPRFRSIGGRKYDNNNNSNLYKNPIYTKAKTWDESTEKWVEVNVSEKSWWATLARAFPIANIKLVLFTIMLFG